MSESTHNEKSSIDASHENNATAPIPSNDITNDKESTDQEISSTSETQEEWIKIAIDITMDGTGNASPNATIVHYGQEKIPPPETPKEEQDIVKIQVASGPGSLESPMLLYNSNRFYQTFIHPDVKGYADIKNMVTTHGGSGALGSTGGVKGYFFCCSAGQGFINVNVSKLAPVQSW